MIRTRALARRFRSGRTTVEAVRGVDLDVTEGELVALLGPNGAGKTTLLRMLTTLLPPTAGSATIAGYDVGTDAARVRARIGVVGQGHGLGESQRARDELLTQARLYGVGRREARARADELLEMLELTGVADRGTPSLSGGQKRRLDIALGLVHRPRMLFLDEPSTGLDPQSRSNLWEHVARLRAEHGTTVLVTTHYLDEADERAERVVVADRGTVIADGTPDALKGRVSGDLITLTLAGPEQARTAAKVAERMPGAGGAYVCTDGEPEVSVRVPAGDAALPPLLQELGGEGAAPRAVRVRRPTLDDVFLNLTGRSLREGE